MMIYHLTLFLIALLEVKCDTIVVFSEKNLAQEAEKRCERNYCLFDAHDEISKATKFQIQIRLKDIYRKSGTKVFIFVTRAIKIYSDFFLHNLMEMIGKKYDNDGHAKDYIGIIFTDRNHGRVFYKYGKNINNGNEISVIIKSFSKRIPSLGIGNAIINMVYTMKPQRFTYNKTYEEDELIMAIKNNEKIIFDPEGYVDQRYMQEINDTWKLIYDRKQIRIHFVYIYGMKFKYSPDSLFVSIEKVLQKKYPEKNILFFYDYSNNLMKYEIKGTKHTAYINSYIEDYKKKYLNNDLGAFTLESLKKIYPNA